MNQRTVTISTNRTGVRKIVGLLMRMSYGFTVTNVQYGQHWDIAWQPGTANPELEAEVRRHLDQAGVKRYTVAIAGPETAPYRVKIIDQDYAAEILPLLGTTTLCVRSHHAHLFSASSLLCYDLDLAALTSDQRERLTQHVAARRGCTPDDAWKKLADTGWPVWVEGTRRLFDDPAGAEEEV
jgi:hypothetical protein